ncbi:MAG: ATP-binding protein [Dissulfurispiraceae bacterium]|jgi:signal transduction histidine kinase|nr:ATP-binding protein [Dissulfurispiraceae bacterium]
MNDVKQIKIRPYARLITMLGEQLIKNERIALIELIKNSYDADADWVKITFQGFGNNYKILPGSKIIIEDNGEGMSQDIIEHHWLNPATPEKKRRKKVKGTTKKGRFIQGEKGIGRFAIFKLGRKIDVISRTKDDEQEHCVSYDFSQYDDDFLTENGKEKDLFIDDLRVSFVNRIPERIVDSIVLLGSRRKTRPTHGTIIEIINLKGTWNENKVKLVYRDLTKLESIFAKREANDFEVSIYKDQEHQKFQEDYIEKLKILLSDRSVIKVEEGFFDADKMEYRFKLNGIPKTITLTDAQIPITKKIRDKYDDGWKILNERKLECGSFNFGFYIFDFSSRAPAKYKLDKEDKEILKSHRIYLYRDDIRVYPYGEPEDDWLQIDVYRGTISAGHFLSNDQVVGFINITQKNNPKLKDKTNREGLIDEGNATEDFITILQAFLAYIRQKPYARYRQDIESKKDQDIFRVEQVQKDFDELKSIVGSNQKALKIISKTENSYRAERQYLTRRAETTEDLAGVGLSVETASHDIMGIMGKVLINIDGLIRDLMSVDEIDKEELLKELQSTRGGISFIEAQLKDIQLLFKSSKQRRKSIRVKDIIEKVERIYRRLLKKEEIQFTINSIGSPLVARTTDAVLLQLLLNLFDNSVYWLQQTSKEDKKIEILLDGNKGRMIFSDNGPGIDKDDIPYIFEPFYSGKGDEGRGLGLYIAKQLLERNEYSINIAEIKSEKLLSGANLVVTLIKEEE